MALKRELAVGLSTTGSQCCSRTLPLIPGFSLCCQGQAGARMQTGRKTPPYLHLHLPHLDHLEEEFVPAVMLYSCMANHGHCFMLPLEP